MACRKAELAAARIVIVAWSRESVQSRWVRAEAQEGLDHQKLVPVFLEAVKPPLIFRAVHSISLADWDGTATSKAFKRLVADINHKLDPTGTADPLAGIRKRLLLNPGNAQLERIAYELRAHLIGHPSDPEALQLRDIVERSLRTVPAPAAQRPRARALTSRIGPLKWTGAAAGVLKGLKPRASMSDDESIRSYLDEKHRRD